MYEPLRVASVRKLRQGAPKGESAISAAPVAAGSAAKEPAVPGGQTVACRSFSS